MSNKLIHTPTLAGITDHSDNSATFSIEPLHTGYGMTLGNSLLRVLLSSIAGAAVTGFRFEGVSHEFTTIAGVKEDVVTIMLNLKGVRFKVFSDEPQTIRLSKKGKGVVKAKDLSLNADIEVVNPSHVIATIDDAKGSIEAELMVETGRGYRALEEQATDKKSTDMI